MDRLEQLNKKKSDIIKRYRRDRQLVDDEIAKEKERIKRDKEIEKEKKEQQVQQNNLALTDTAYKDFVKDSLSIAELNEKLKEILNQK